jgi:hypothetical protein
MKDYEKALKMKSNDPDLYYNRGLVYLSEGHKKEADADFNRAAALRSEPPLKPPAKSEVKAKKIAGFDQVDIRNVPLAPFFDEVKDKIDISIHPAYLKMAQRKGNYRQIVDPFYFKRGTGKAPDYAFRQFTSSRSMPEIIDWYKKKSSPGADGTGDAFARGGGSYANGPFENRAANFGVNNGRNFIVLTLMKAPEEDKVTVYLFHYRKGPTPKKKAAQAPVEELKPGMLVEVKEGQGWFGAKILKIDPTRDKPYYVEYTGYVDYYRWVGRDAIRPRVK